MKGSALYIYIFLLAFIAVYPGFSLAATVQANPFSSKAATDTSTIGKNTDYKQQKDLIDITNQLLHKNADLRIDSLANKNNHLYFTVAPIIEITLATGFTGGVVGNAALRTSLLQQTNTSTFLGAVKYTQKKQMLIPLQSSIWTPGNKYNLVGDWRYLNYPQDTYGFGGHTLLTDKYIVSFQYMRFYEQVLKRLKKDIYLGAGYQFDHHWDISESELRPGQVTDFQKYGFSKNSTSSGIALNVLYDSRENGINPKGGSMYANIQFVQNTRILGASTNWNSVLIDLRKYIKLPFHTILALWCYSVFVLNGNPPYLDLPATGYDTYNNTGRGYEQSRFTGKKMIDLEAELRFNITKDGFLGGVVFGNAESLSELGSNRFEVISPAFGFGLRIKFNKFSGTNACIDYGIGKNGSKGFVGNLGEVF